MYASGKLVKLMLNSYIMENIAKDCVYDITEIINKMLATLHLFLRERVKSTTVPRTKMQKRKMWSNSLAASIDFYKNKVVKKERGDTNGYFQVDDNGIVHPSSFINEQHTIMFFTPSGHDDIVLGWDRMIEIRKGIKKDVYIPIDFANGDYYIGGKNVSMNGRMIDEQSHDKMIEVVTGLYNLHTGSITIAIDSIVKRFDEEIEKAAKEGKDTLEGFELRFEHEVTYKNKKLVDVLFINKQLVQASVVGKGSFNFGKYTIPMLKPVLAFMKSFCKSIVISAGNMIPIKMECVGASIGSFLMAPLVPEQEKDDPYQT
jgi:hypothetical protein